MDMPFPSDKQDLPRLSHLDSHSIQVDPPQNRSIKLPVARPLPVRPSVATRAQELLFKRGGVYAVAGLGRLGPKALTGTSGKRKL